MMFLSQRPNNDPQKYVAVNGVRASVSQWAAMSGESRKDYILDPRPEFTHTRDPYPYVGPNGATRHAFPGWLGSDRLVWSPRHEEFDTPVNGILSAYRKRGTTALWWVDSCDSGQFKDQGYTPDEIAHARRVLHLLAVISE